MKKVAVEDSVGMVLGHDLTKIIPGEFKGAAFKKGHIITEQDIDMLKSMGKDHIYIFELGEDKIHENEAAIAMARAASGQGLEISDPSEGKVNMIASWDGLLKIDRARLSRINSIEYISMASLHGNIPVKKGQIVAGTRIIPLVTERSRILEVETICAEGEKILCIKPYKKLRIGFVVTGNEVFYGRIEDRFAAVMKEKMAAFGLQLEDIRYVPDEAERIKEVIRSMKEKGMEAIITAGGMSVDPDDVTPDGIRLTGAEVISYGAPVLPGAMFMLAYLGEIPIMGVPACGMFHKTTVFDLILVRVLAGERISKKDIVELGYGGLCMNCKPCTYPNCSFGRI